MIIGLGTDILDINRFEHTLKKYGQQVLDRLFTSAEQAYCDATPRLRVSRYAKRFCAKEAALKALGTGRSHGIKWHDVSVSHDRQGKPILLLTGKALAFLTHTLNQHTYHAHVSLSDSEHFATAVVILEDKP